MKNLGLLVSIWKMSLTIKEIINNWARLENDSYIWCFWIQSKLISF